MIYDKQFRKALDRFFTQSQNVSTVEIDIGSRVKPRNVFEKVLESAGLELRIDNDSKIFAFLGLSSYIGSSYSFLLLSSSPILPFC